MTDFNEQQHPRATDGRFAAKDVPEAVGGPEALAADICTCTDDETCDRCIDAGLFDREPDEEFEQAATASVHDVVLAAVPDVVAWEVEVDRVDGSWEREYGTYVTARAADGIVHNVPLLGTPAVDALTDWEQSQRDAYGDTEALEPVAWAKPAERACPMCDVELPDDDAAVNAHYDQAHRDDENSQEG